MLRYAESVLRDLYDAWRAQDIETVASYLPGEFSHTVYIPADVHPMGGTCTGKISSMQRLSLIAAEFDLLHFETIRLMTDRNRAAVEIPMRYRHRGTGVHLESIFVNFWTFEAERPVRLNEYHDISRIKSFVTELAARLAKPA
jgi:ketosteroid isomerase-like protein